MDGPQMREIRTGAGVTLREFARELDRTEPELSKWEREIRPIPAYLDYITVIEATANALDRRVGYHEAEARVAKAHAERLRRLCEGG